MVLEEKMFENVGIHTYGPVVSEEKIFENVDINKYIHTTEAYLYYKLTNEPKGSGELINSMIGFLILSTGKKHGIHD